MLSSLVMLNLVVGVVCSAMTEATENHSKGAEKEACLQKVVDECGVPRKIVDTWADVRAQHTACRPLHASDVADRCNWLLGARKLDTQFVCLYCAGLCKIG
jgi:hypothetical protein|eukprot:COSAG02_NODE_6067_length_3828_cov_1.288549_5_plen_101_part_00